MRCQISFDVIILKRMFEKWDVGVWTASIWLRIRSGGGLL
jgi:hypothetical protein